MTISRYHLLCIVLVRPRDEPTDWARISEIQTDFSRILSGKIQQNQKLFVSDIVPFIFDIFECTRQRTSYQDM